MKLAQCKELIENYKRWALIKAFTMLCQIWCAKIFEVASKVLKMLILRVMSARCCQVPALASGVKLHDGSM